MHDGNSCRSHVPLATASRFPEYAPVVRFFRAQRRARCQSRLEIERWVWTWSPPCAYFNESLREFPHSSANLIARDALSIAGLVGIFARTYRVWIAIDE